jgi:two-component system chemotaxis response regulator CheB
MDSSGVRTPVIVIGGSAGALLPLRQVVLGLPADIGAAVLVAMHMPEDSPSGLASVLSSAGPLHATFAEDGAALTPGLIQVAPPGHHLLVHENHVALSRGARENGLRPAIDPLFRSAAAHHGAYVISILLSGTLDDGSAGTAAVCRAGGITIVQDPEDAQFPDMPRNAIATDAVRHILPARRIALLVEDLIAAILEGEPGAAQEVEAGSWMPSWERGSEHSRPAAATAANPRPPAGDPEHLVPEGPFTDPSAGALPRGTARQDADGVDRGLAGPATDLDGRPSPYSCPACGGVLYERRSPLQYLCRLGHRYSPESLVYDQESVVDEGLWIALRSLEEEASLAERLRDRAAANEDDRQVPRYEARRAAAQSRADRIRALLRGEPPVPMPLYYEVVGDGAVIEAPGGEVGAAAAASLAGSTPRRPTGSRR